MAEWLRRLTRNQMGYARAGSNPARSERVLNPRPLGPRAQTQKFRISTTVVAQVVCIMTKSVFQSTIVVVKVANKAV